MKYVTEVEFYPKECGEDEQFFVETLQSIWPDVKAVWTTCCPYARMYEVFVLCVPTTTMTMVMTTTTTTKTIIVSTINPQIQSTNKTHKQIDRNRF